MSVYQQIRQEFEAALIEVVEKMPESHKPSLWKAGDRQPTLDYYWNICKKSGDGFSAEATAQTLRLPELRPFAFRMEAYNKKRIKASSPRFDHFLDRDDWDEMQASR